MGKQSKTKAPKEDRQGKVVAANTPTDTPKLRGFGEGPQFLTLDDGTKIPVGLPPGVDPAQAQQAIEYLKANPELAKQAAANVKGMMGSNPMAYQNMFKLQNAMGRDNVQQRMHELRDDPELQPIFEDIQKNGMGALQKYYDDEEWCEKVSQKLGPVPLGAAEMMQVKRPPPPKPVAGPAPPSEEIKDFCDAAKFDDVAAIKRLLAEKRDPDTKNDKGVTPLGMACGFGAMSAIAALLDAGASTSATDGQGNSPLHYAAGYGQQPAVRLLLDRGADASAANGAGLKPAQAAAANGHKEIVAMLGGDAEAPATPRKDGAGAGEVMKPASAQYEYI